MVKDFVSANNTAKLEERLQDIRKSSKLIESHNFPQQHEYTPEYFEAFHKYLKTRKRTSGRVPVDRMTPTGSLSVNVVEGLGSGSGGKGVLGRPRLYCWGRISRARPHVKIKKAARARVQLERRNEAAFFGAWRSRRSNEIRPIASRALSAKERLEALTERVRARECAASG